MIAGVAVGASMGAWTVLAVSGVRRRRRVRDARAGSPDVAAPAAVMRPQVSAPVASELYDHADEEVVAVVRPTWTPQPLPKPLHLSRGTIAASAMASIDAATEPVLTLTGRNIDGSTFKIQRGWPVLHVAGRFPPAPGNNVVPTFILQSKIPPPSYRLDPSALGDALEITGFLVIACGLGAGARLFARSWVRRDAAVANGVPLARALALVRAALTREPADRRRAVGLLARTLPTEDASLQSIAVEVAWSQPEPSESRIEELLRIVEAEYEESS